MLDALLAASAPAIVIADATLAWRGGDSIARLEAVVFLVVGLPWIAVLPVIVRAWLRRTGLPNPGQFLHGARRSHRQSGPMGDFVLIVVAALASIPLFYASTIAPSDDIGVLLMAAVPFSMAVGTLLTVSRPREPAAPDLSHLESHGDRAGGWLP
ncbi:MAG: hypothetical protein KY469_06380 [Actinobacteria bacterium]|nr:hypothetical protein [Actinomycetota bacterium]